MIGREVEFEPPQAGCTVAGLRELLARRYPNAAPDLSKPSLRACVGDTIVGEQFPVDGAAKVEFFPPLSGG
jgi:molybdopterin converting factor small subunit